MARFNHAERRALGTLGTITVKLFGYGWIWVGFGGFAFLAATLNSSGWRFQNQGLEELSLLGAASACLLIGMLYLRFIDHQRRRYLEHLYREGKLPPRDAAG